MSLAPSLPQKEFTGAFNTTNNAVVAATSCGTLGTHPPGTQARTSP